MSPEACVAYLDQTLPFEFCWNALVSLKSNPETIVFCVELDLQDLLLKVIVLYIALVPLSLVYSNTMYFHWSSFSAFNFALHGVNGHPSSVYIAVCTVPSSKIQHIALLDLVYFIHSSSFVAYGHPSLYIVLLRQPV